MKDDLDVYIDSLTKRQKKPKLSPDEISKTLREAGWDEEHIPTMTAIAQAESSGKPSAHNPKYPDDSYGLWQVNRLAHPEYSPDFLRDPVNNAKAALDIFGKKKQGFRAWSVYKDGSYKKYLNRSSSGGGNDDLDAYIDSLTTGGSPQEEESTPQNAALAEMEQLAAQSKKVSEPPPAAALIQRRVSRPSGYTPEQKKLIEEARQEWRNQNTKIAQNADPELKAKLLQDPEKATPEDIIKWARSQGQKLNIPLQPSISKPFLQGKLKGNEELFFQARQRGINIEAIRRQAAADAERRRVPTPYSDQYGTRVRLSPIDQSAIDIDTQQRVAAELSEAERKERVSQAGVVERFLQGPKSIIGGGVDTIASAPKLVGILARKANSSSLLGTALSAPTNALWANRTEPFRDRDGNIVAPGREKDADEYATYRIGQWASDSIRNLPGFLRSNPDLEQEFLEGQLPNAIGQGLTMIAGGRVLGASKLAIMLTGGSMVATDAYEEVKRAGGTEDEALNLGLLAGAILGPTELFGFRGVLDALEGTAQAYTIRSAAKLALKTGFKDALENSIQEAGQELGQGLITGQLRSLEDIGTAALVGALSSGITTTGVTAGKTALDNYLSKQSQPSTPAEPTAPPTTGVEEAERRQFEREVATPADREVIQREFDKIKIREGFDQIQQGQVRDELDRVGIRSEFDQIRQRELARTSEKKEGPEQQTATQEEGVVGTPSPTPPTRKIGNRTYTQDEFGTWFTGKRRVRKQEILDALNAPEASQQAPSAATPTPGTVPAITRQSSGPSASPIIPPLSREQGAAPVRTAPPTPSGLTRMQVALAQALKQRDYSDAEIARMSPEEAQEIVEREPAKKPKTPEVVSGRKMRENFQPKFGDVDVKSLPNEQIDALWKEGQSLHQQFGQEGVAKWEEEFHRRHPELSANSIATIKHGTMPENWAYYRNEPGDPSVALFGEKELRSGEAGKRMSKTNQELKLGRAIPEVTGDKGKIIEVTPKKTPKTDIEGTEWLEPTPEERKRIQQQVDAEMKAKGIKPPKLKAAVRDKETKEAIASRTLAWYDESVHYRSPKGRRITNKDAKVLDHEDREASSNYVPWSRYEPEADVIYMNEPALRAFLVANGGAEHLQDAAVGGLTMHLNEGELEGLDILESIMSSFSQSGFQTWRNAVLEGYVPWEPVSTLDFEAGVEGFFMDLRNALLKSNDIRLAVLAPDTTALEVAHTNAHESIHKTAPGNIFKELINHPDTIEWQSYLILTGDWRQLGIPKARDTQALLSETLAYGLTGELNEETLQSEALINTITTMIKYLRDTHGNMKVEELTRYATQYGKDIIQKATSTGRPGEGKAVSGESRPGDTSLRQGRREGTEGGTAEDSQGSQSRFRRVVTRFISDLGSDNSILKGLRKVIDEPSNTGPGDRLLTYKLPYKDATLKVRLRLTDGGKRLVILSINWRTNDLLSDIRNGNYFQLHKIGVPAALKLRREFKRLYPQVEAVSFERTGSTANKRSVEHLRFISDPPKKEHPWRTMIKELDAKGAPDEAYKRILSTGTKDPLRKGETWRSRVEKLLERIEGREAESVPQPPKRRGDERSAQEILDELTIKGWDLYISGKTDFDSWRDAMMKEFGFLHTKKGQYGNEALPVIWQNLFHPAGSEIERPTEATPSKLTDKEQKEMLKSAKQYAKDKKAPVEIPTLGNLPKPETKERSFHQSLEEGGRPGGSNRFYQVIGHDAQIERARKQVEEEGVDVVASKILGGDISSNHLVAAGLAVIDEFQQAGKFDRAGRIAGRLDAELTNAGRLVESAKLAKILEPGTILVMATKEMRKQYDDAGREFSEEESRKLYETSRRALDLESEVLGLKEREEDIDPETAAQAVEDLLEQHQNLRDRLYRRAEEIEAGARARLQQRKAIIEMGTHKSPSANVKIEAPPPAGGPLTKEDIERGRATRAQRRAEEKPTRRGPSLGGRGRGQKGSTPIFNDLADYAAIGTAKMMKGTINFADWSQEMISEFGEDIEPYLSQLFRRSGKDYLDHKSHEKRQADVLRVTKGHPEDFSADEINELLKLEKQRRSLRAKDRAELRRRATFNYPREQRPPREKHPKPLPTAPAALGRKIAELGRNEDPDVVIGALKQERAITRAQWEKEMADERGINVHDRKKLTKLFTESYRLRQLAVSELATDRVQRSQGVTAEEAAEIILERRIKTQEAMKARREMQKTYLQLTQTPGQKLRQGIFDLINVPKAVRTSADFSAPGRQGWVLLTGKPNKDIQLRALRNQFENFASKELFEENVEELIHHPRFIQAIRNGLFIAEQGADDVLSSFTNREEAYMSKLAHKIPLVARSSRAYSGYLDWTRLGYYDMIASEFERRSMTEATHPTEFKNLAEVINTFTGRGNLSKAATAAAPVLNALTWSPRFIKSRFQLLNPLWYARLRRSSPETAKFAAKTVARSLGTNLSILGLFAAAGAAGIAPGVSVNWDRPEDSDWLRVRIGSTEYDLSAGTQQFARLYWRILKNSYDHFYSGKKNVASPVEVLRDFFRNKAAPTPEFFITLWKGEDFEGRKLSEKTALDHILSWGPILGEDIKDAIKEDGWAAGIPVSVASASGIGTSTFRESGFRAIDQNVRKELSKLDLDFQEVFGQKTGLDDVDKALLKETELLISQRLPEVINHPGYQQLSPKRQELRLKEHLQRLRVDAKARLRGKEPALYQQLIQKQRATANAR